ncbi:MULTISPECIES: ABC transporter permease [unclassified Bacillus (in: firmicutes)]|uniref:ABC transporter permease n=1 Tax=unclassified Bacillus (in: firmicutes) TaxID=185979 RepID=UPI0004E1D378|nr:MULTISPECIES: ABC transporter permease [unclassified Bacillus (in: firmicutes)]
MNIMNKLTLRNLKENKRRTLVTIIGVIIAVSMLTAVSTLGVSFIDLLKRDSIARDGEWHAQFIGVNNEQAKELRKDSNMEKVILSNNLGYANWKDSKNDSKPYLFFKQYDEQGFEQFLITLKEGTFPKASNEIIIPDEMRKKGNSKYAIGEEINVSIGERHFQLEEEDSILTQTNPLQRNEEGKSVEEIQQAKSYTFKIVGIMETPSWEPSWSPGYTVISYLDQKELTTSSSVNASVVMKKVKQSIYEDSESLAKKLAIAKVDFNNELLRYYGVSSNDNLLLTMYSLIGIVILVIVIGSVALIYNAFAISVSERARHLGMLSSVGATKKQKRNSVFFEGAVIGGISIPLGIIAGIVGIGITFTFINKYLQDALNSTQGLNVVVTPYSILFSIIISIVTIFISTYLPARKASKISAIDAIRQTQDIKLSGKKVKTSKFVRKVFGIEAEIGLKNLKRNKRRYQTTVFSLIISILLFLVVSYFTDNMKKSVELSQENIDYDITVSAESNVAEEEMQILANVPSITESNLIKSTYVSTYLDKSVLSENNKKSVENGDAFLEEGKLPFTVNFFVLSESAFKQYAQEVGFNINEYTNPTEPKGIVIENVSYFDPYGEKFVEEKVLNAKPGDYIDLYMYREGSEKEEMFNKVQIGLFTNETFMGMNADNYRMITMIISNEVAENLFENEKNITMNYNLYLNSDNPDKAEEELDDLKSGSMYIYNVEKNRKQSEQMIMIMAVFMYGFITLISLISIANIFNTISTSISLRKREFAMLRSVGMTPTGFNKMIYFESIFYGIKALMYGIPISIGVIAALYWSISNTFEYGFELPWLSILFVVIAIFIIVASAMLYSVSKIKKENIIDGLKQENA